MLGRRAGLGRGVPRRGSGSTTDRGVTELRRVEHTPAGRRGLIARIAHPGARPGRGPGGGRDPPRAAGRCPGWTRGSPSCRSTPTWSRVGAARRGKKDDPEDARICCLLAMDRTPACVRWSPIGELAAELRSIARDDDRACPRRAAAAQPAARQTCSPIFPAALSIDGDDLGAPTLLRLLAAAGPPPTELATAGRAEIWSPWPAAAGTAGPNGSPTGSWPPSAAEQLHRPRLSWSAPRPTPSALAATQLLAIGSQRRAWERRMGELLLGRPA